MDELTSGSFPVAGFGIINVEPSGSYTKKFLSKENEFTLLCT